MRHGSTNSKRLSKNQKLKIGAGGLVFIFTAFFTASCMPELKEEGPTTDNEVGVQAIADALDAATSGHTPSDLPVGTATLFESNYRVETSAPEIYAYTTTELIAKVDSATNVRLTFKETTEDMSSRPSKVTVVESVLDIAKTPTTSAQSLGRIELMKQFNESRGFVRTQAAAGETTFHDLKVASKTENYPGACVTNPTCQVQVTEVSFAVIDWTSETEFEKTHLVYRFSKNIPRVHKVWEENIWSFYSSSALSFCQSQKYPDVNRDLLVTFCDVLKATR